MHAAFAVIERAIRAGPIPGAAVALGTGDGEMTACFGHLEPDGDQVTDGTWYDLASLTKVLCTVPLVLEAVAAGALDPRVTLRDVLPEIAWMQPTPNLGDATILQLVTHTSGLPAWAPLYTLGLDRPTLLARVLHTELKHSVGEIVYSDFGYIILGHLLERVHGIPLPEQAARLYARLGIGEVLRFGPLRNGERVAPTEQCPWRGRILRGEVHDENASALGGVAGHAGLFGTLRGVTDYAHALLDGRLHPPAVIEYLSQEHARSGAPDFERRAFGWGLHAPGWSGGELMSRNSIGHTGFTGTGVWIDLERRRFSVLLTNRVHPTRHIESGIRQLRRAFNHAAHAA